MSTEFHGTDDLLMLIDYWYDPEVPFIEDDFLEVEE